MGSKQRGNHNLQTSKRTRISHIQQMHNNDVNENARDNDDFAFINEGSSINMISQIDMPYNDGMVQVHRKGRGRGAHNCARDFHEIIGVTKCRLPTPRSCQYCCARLFHHESNDMCCLNRKTIIPIIQCPPEMLQLFSTQTPEGTHFRQHIRAYNGCTMMYNGCTMSLQ